MKMPNDGTWLALGALGLLAAGSHMRGSSDRGSRAVSRVQQALLRLKNTYRDQPETTVRAIDFVISSLPDFPPGTGMSRGLPAVWSPSGKLVEQIQAFTGKPDATMSDYRDLVVDFVRNDSYGEAMSEPIVLSVDWEFAPQIPWLAREVARLVKDHRRGRIDEDVMLESIAGMRERLAYVFDWVYATRPDLNRFTFDEAHHESTEWHNRAQEQVNRAQIQRKRREGRWFDCPGGIATERGEVVQRFPNGWTIQRLTTWKQFQEEANLSKGGGCLKHCVGEGDSYFRATDEGSTFTESFRSPDNHPFLTITRRASDGSVSQVKGLQNRIPGMVQDRSGQGIALLKRLGGAYTDIEDYLDDEAKMLTAYFRENGYAFNADSSSVVHRLRDIAQRQQEAKAKKQGGRNWYRVLGGWSQG